MVPGHTRPSLSSDAILKSLVKFSIHRELRIRTSDTSAYMDPLIEGHGLDLIIEMYFLVVLEAGIQAQSGAGFSGGLCIVLADATFSPSLHMVVLPLRLLILVSSF